jgi:hypothetical protein
MKRILATATAIRLVGRLRSGPVAATDARRRRPRSLQAWGRSDLLKTGVYRGKAGFDRGPAAIKQFAADYVRRVLDLGMDFPAPFVWRGFFKVEINAAVFHRFNSSFASALQSLTER